MSCWYRIAVDCNGFVIRRLCPQQFESVLVLQMSKLKVDKQIRYLRNNLYKL